MSTTPGETPDAADLALARQHHDELSRVQDEAPGADRALREMHARHAEEHLAKGRTMDS